MTEDLKSCPFCFEMQNIILGQCNIRPWSFTVICGDCGTSSGFFDTSYEARQAWNQITREQSASEEDSK